MKKSTKKLVLAKETIRGLLTGEIEQVAGGASNNRGCPTAYTCDPCMTTRVCTTNFC